MTQPNIIFILIDDLGWTDLTCCGSGFYETPNLDRLATQGMRLTDAYAAAPVCSPTRASIVTGKYPAALGITDWIDSAGHMHPLRGQLVDVPYLKRLTTSEHSVARALRDGGYATWHVGKWHLGGEGFMPEDHGFEVNIGGCNYGSPGANGYFSPWSIPVLADADVPKGTYLGDYLTDRAIELIRKRDGRPFFMNFWHYDVHIPIQGKPELIAKYEAKARALGLDKLPTFEDCGPFPTEDKRDRHVIRRLLHSDPVYAAMIESLDANIGRLMDALNEEGLADNTVVMFTSDNGGLVTAEGSPTCNAPLAEGKGWMYEGGTREPLLVCWPGVARPGSVCSEPVTSTDFYPTFLEMAGLPLLPAQHADGVSMVPVLRGGSAPEGRALFWHYPHYGNQGGTPGSSVRLGDYKLIEFFEDGRLELYNLREDISETRNLAAAMPAKVEELRALLDDWRRRVEAAIPARNPKWQER